jgi:threonine dehydrogenase-like Zn-dependent dehydrogenase
MGAHEVVDPSTTPAMERWREVDGRRSVVVYEAVGVPGMIESAMREAPRGAQVLVVGVCMQSDSIRPMFGIAKELSIQFVLGYDPVEFGETLRRIAEGEVDVDPMITGSVDIDGVAGAFEALRDPEAHAKILVQPTP